MVLFFPVAEIVAKSARLVSMFNKAAIPPLLFISDKRSSLNQTSPLIASRILIPLLFFTPTIKVRANPKFGFPFIPNRNLLVFADKEASN